MTALPDKARSGRNGARRRVVRCMCLAAVLVLVNAFSLGPSSAVSMPGCVETTAGLRAPQAGAIIEPACLVEWLGILRSYWDLGLGLILNGEPGTDCYRLAVTGDVLSVMESVLSYSICAMRQAEEPDEELLLRREITRKMVLIIYEFLYIIDLLDCYPTR